MAVDRLVPVPTSLEWGAISSTAPSLVTSGTALRDIWLFGTLSDHTENTQAASTTATEAVTPAPGGFTQVTTDPDNVC
jgi:hypothetical protein